MFLRSQLIGHFVHGRRKLIEDLCGYMAVGCGYFGLGNHSVSANKSQEKCSYGQGYQFHLGIRYANAGLELIPVDLK